MIAPMRSHTWTARRFIIAALLLVAATLAAALGFIDWRMEHVIADVERSAMADEMDALSVIAREEGADALRDALRVSARIGDDHALHQLVDAHGAALAGNLGAWPPALEKDGVWTHFTVVAADGARIDADGIATTLPGGSRLLIGRDLEDHRIIHGDALEAFAAALLLAVGVTLAIGVWVDRLLVARVADFSRTAEAVMAGRLDARVPAANSRDELSRMARTINAMLDRIESLMTGMRAITDSLAHDLRTPLTRLSAHLEIAADPHNTTPAEALLAAHAEAERLRSTFETLIDIARAEAGISRETMAQTDVGALVADICELFSPAAEDKDITLSVTTSATLFSAQRALVSQAVGNLLDNAIKYTPEGGAIVVTVASVPDGVDVTVADTGPGIPTDLRDAALERFKRLARDSTAPGSGLGLSIAAATARLHAGKLRLEDGAPGLRAVLELRRPV